MQMIAPNIHGLGSRAGRVQIKHNERANFATSRFIWAFSENQPVNQIEVGYDWSTTNQGCDDKILQAGHMALLSLLWSAWERQ